MKQAKKSLFLQHQNQRLNLSIQARTPVKGLPSQALMRKAILKTLPIGYQAAQISIQFVNATEGAQLNATYREKDYATNVLSFALNEGDAFEDLDLPLIGDLVLCPEVIESEALAQNKTLVAHYIHLIIHGSLHLQGFDHINEQDAEEMESLECRIMQQLGFDNPYHTEAEAK